MINAFMSTVVLPQYWKLRTYIMLTFLNNQALCTWLICNYLSISLY